MSDFAVAAAIDRQVAAEKVNSKEKVEATQLVASALQAVATALDKISYTMEYKL